MGKIIPALVVCVALTGCATQTFDLRSGSDSPEYTSRQTFFINGLWQDSRVDASVVCGGADQVAKVEVEQRITDGVLSLLTLGLYTPRTARVYCVQ